jgi:hypothetical protein
MNTLEENKLIAEFMTDEPEVLANDLLRDGTLECMEYHNDWLWLMPVVEKIEKLWYTVEISTTHCSIKGFNDDLSSFYKICGSTINTEGKTKLDCVYSCVVQFIEWFNENN